MFTRCERHSRYWHYTFIMRSQLFSSVVQRLRRDFHESCSFHYLHITNFLRLLSIHNGLQKHPQNKSGSYILRTWRQSNGPTATSQLPFRKSQNSVYQWGDAPFCCLPLRILPRGYSVIGKIFRRILHGVFTFAFTSHAPNSRLSCSACSSEVEGALLTFVLTGGSLVSKRSCLASSSTRLWSIENKRFGIAEGWNRWIQAVLTSILH